MYHEGVEVASCQSVPIKMDAQQTRHYWHEEEVWIMYDAKCVTVAGLHIVVS